MARILYSGVDEHGQPSEVMLGCAIGDIIPHFGTTAPPGTLVCDGSEVSREAYAELYEKIGSLVGQGDGSTTFNLPDLRGRWMVGADVEHTAGEEVAEGLPNINGRSQYRSFTPPDQTYGIVLAYNDSNAMYTEEHAAEQWSYGIAGGAANGKNTRMWFDASKSNPIYGASQHVTPASVAVLPCIVYG